MKAHVAVAIFLTTITVNGGPVVEDIGNIEPSLIHAALHAKWHAYKARHGKEYASHEEEAKKKAFLEHTHTIEEHNARFYRGLESFELAHNHLSDLTLEEIVSTRMGVSMPSNAHEIMANSSVHKVDDECEVPPEFDWRNYSAVTPVKNQGSCGSCYSFSAAGALETAYWRMYKSILNVSEQDIVDCTDEYGNAGCGGGWMHTAFQWLHDHNGYVAEENYPYKAMPEICKHNATAKIGPVIEFVRIAAGNESDILHAVATVGTVSTAFNAGNPQYVHYSSGIIDMPDCGDRPTHAVLIVGYGTENGTDYWTIKNSWGSNWGENGYFRIKRGVNMCGLADWASYPIVGNYTNFQCELQKK